MLSLSSKQAALINKYVLDASSTYVCVGCVFAVHQDCMYFPNDIIISRHQHSIHFTSSLPSGHLSCGVCRRKVDNNYGAYTCNNCDEYFVHTRCALRKDVWLNRTDLDIEEVLEDVEPLEWIDDGIILHFSHDHHLKLEMISRVYDEEKLCQACILPIYEDNYYSCVDECDFILHERCAFARRKIRHLFHPHPLKLKVVTNGYNNKGHFCCNVCGQESCGFVYECSIGGCEFRLDLRCALISEPFHYQGHEHPLFLTLDLDESMSGICQICQEDSDENKYLRVLNCIECYYVICFKCATLPYKARYEDDTHFLTFGSWGETSGHLDWCDLCERKIEDSTKEGFYRCNDCSNTLHVNCLLGKDPYMKPGQTIIYHGMELHILRNDTTLFRPFCHCCEQHCPHRVVFKKNNEVYCSLSCVSKFRG